MSYLAEAFDTGHNLGSDREQSYSQVYFFTFTFTGILCSAFYQKKIEILNLPLLASSDKTKYYLTRGKCPSNLRKSGNWLVDFFPMNFWKQWICSKYLQAISWYLLAGSIFFLAILFSWQHLLAGNICRLAIFISWQYLSAGNNC